eukprot:TRINITY_DN12341_c0_g1_i1.p1 TRINITY_DN12341_c0_g1~~TRINITY_DN12341_c0_g1_i1.p1  ORF type:complete len:196 (+),score=45.51 TRINITY_DN12341_c0_g1_i1:1229-1816(+)
MELARNKKLDELQTMYEAHNLKGDGVFSYKEFAYMIRHWRPEVNDKQMILLYRHAVAGRMDNAITFENFVNAASHIIASELLQPYWDSQKRTLFDQYMQQRQITEFAHSQELLSEEHEASSLEINKKFIRRRDSLHIQLKSRQHDDLPEAAFDLETTIDVSDLLSSKDSEGQLIEINQIVATEKCMILIVESSRC